MDKDKEIEELEYIIQAGKEQKKSPKSIAIRIQLEGYRNTTDLKAWLKGMQKLNKWEGKNKPIDIWQIILNKIGYITSCGYAYAIKEPKFKYCPHCHKPIEVKEDDNE